MTKSARPKTGTIGWTDLTVDDAETLRNFYSEVVGWTFSNVDVHDLDQSIARCLALGGELISGPKSMASMGRYCAIKDPAGAIMSLFEPL